MKKKQKKTFDVVFFLKHDKKILILQVFTKQRKKNTYVELEAVCEPCNLNRYLGE